MLSATAQRPASAAIPACNKTHKSLNLGSPALFLLVATLLIGVATGCDAGRSGSVVLGARDLGLDDLPAEVRQIASQWLAASVVQCGKDSYAIMLDKNGNGLVAEQTEKARFWAEHRPVTDRVEKLNNPSLEDRYNLYYTFPQDTLQRSCVVERGRLRPHGWSAWGERPAFAGNAWLEVDKINGQWKIRQTQRQPVSLTPLTCSVLGGSY